MRAVVIDAPGSAAAVRDVPEPTPGPADVVVAVRGCGICGTDKHILTEGLPTAAYPLVPGHEPWGEVVAVGAATSLVAVGDVVAVDPSLHCGACPECRRGRGNLCHRWGAIGGTRAGAWADLVVAPERNAYVLPEGYPLACASLIEPVACALRGLKRLSAEPGRSCLIVGGGTMGILLGILLEINGCEPVTVVEADAGRRAFTARATGLHVIGPDELGDLAADYVIDATGVPAAIEAAFERVAPGGSFMVFGVASPDARVSISPFLIYQREITVVGSMAILHTFQPAVEIVAAHAERFQPLLTHTFELSEFDTALATLSQSNAVKVTIGPQA
jgi:2-desacetyl-2-hydroxyethyl bacteriochlorophyllide A dehydrogenase